MMDIGHEPSLIPPEPPQRDLEEEWADLLYAAHILGDRDGRGQTKPLDLSGQWACEPTPRDVVAWVFAEAKLDMSVWLPDFDYIDWTSLLDEYEEAYNFSAHPTYVAGEDDPPDAYERGVVA